MSIIETIILGAIQGLTEFIPISSSGHLVVAQLFLSGSSSHLFLEYINIGTLLALLIFFRVRIVDILRGVIISKDIKLASNILVTALPAGLIGFTLASFIETNSFFSNMLVVAVAMGLVGLIMVILERIPRLSDVNNMRQLSYKRALGIGLAQIAALIPGVSRSGSTIIAGRLFGLNYKSSAEYSFLVSIPIMLGVCVKLLLTNYSYIEQNIYTILIGNGVAFVTGFFAIGFLVRYLSNNNLAIFGWYRIIVALILIIILIL